MATRRKNAPTLDEALRNLEHTVGALVGQMTAAMESLTLMRADQMRMMEKLGLLEHGQAPHRCVDEEPAHRKVKTVELKGRRKTGGRRG